MNEIVPFEDHVIVDIEAAREKGRVVGGIALPDDDKSMDNFAIVIAKGPLAPATLAIGDRVALPRGHGTKLVINSRTVVAMRAKDIIAKLAPVTGMRVL